MGGLTCSPSFITPYNPSLTYRCGTRVRVRVRMYMYGVYPVWDIPHTGYTPYILLSCLHPMYLGVVMMDVLIFFFVLLCSYHESLSISHPEGQDTCGQKPVTWQPQSKAFIPIARQGAGIYRAPHPPPFFLHPFPHCTP